MFCILMDLRDRRQATLYEVICGEPMIRRKKAWTRPTGARTLSRFLWSTGHGSSYSLGWGSLGGFCGLRDIVWSELWSSDDWSKRIPSPRICGLRQEEAFDWLVCMSQIWLESLESLLGLPDTDKLSLYKLDFCEVTCVCHPMTMFQQLANSPTLIYISTNSLQNSLFNFLSFFLN